MRVLSSEPPLFMPHPRELVEAGRSPPQPNCSTWVERQIPFKRILPADIVQPAVETQTVQNAANR